MGGANSRNQEKGVILQAWVREILKKGTFCMNLLPFVCSECLNCYASMYLSFNHNLEVMKNTTYIEKCLEFDVVTYILIFTKRVHYLTLRKNRVLLKKGCFIERQNQRFRLKKGCFFRPKSAKRGYFFNLGTSVVYALVGSRGAGPQFPFDVILLEYEWSFSMSLLKMSLFTYVRSCFISNNIFLDVSKLTFAANMALCR